MKRSTSGNASPLAFLQGLLLSVTAIPACIVGLIPALHWGARYQWANFTFALQLGSVNTINVGLRAQYHGHLALIRDETIFYFKYVLPRLIGGALPDENSTLTTLHTFTFYLGVLCLLITCMLVALSLVWHQPQLVRVRQLGALPLLFALCAAFTFCTSTVTSAGLINFQHDIAGRYGTPLMLVLPYFFAMIFTLASMSIYALWKRRTLASENEVRQPSRPAKLFTVLRISMVAQVILFALLFIYLGTQAYTYMLADPDETYQSASCPIAPAYNDPIIAYLQQEHVHYAWAITWIGNPIIFKTNDGIILSDPRSILYHNGLGRVPAYTEAVLHADRPAMLTIVKHNDTYPVLLRILDQKQVTYTAKRFPSEPGYDVLVVTSLSRTVALSESKAFSSAFPGCI